MSEQYPETSGELFWWMRQRIHAAAIDPEVQAVLSEYLDLEHRAIGPAGITAVQAVKARLDIIINIKMFEYDLLQVDHADMIYREARRILGADDF